MANTICTACGKRVSWRAGRDTRLADLRCTCGRTLAGMTAGFKSANTGKHYMTCQVCGRKTLHVLTTTQDWPGWDGKIIPAGTVLCAWHDVKVPDEQYRGGWRFSNVRRAEAYHK